MTAPTARLLIVSKELGDRLASVQCSTRGGELSRMLTVGDLYQLVRSAAAFPRWSLHTTHFRSHRATLGTASPYCGALERGSKRGWTQVPPSGPRYSPE